MNGYKNIGLKDHKIAIEYEDKRTFFKEGSTRSISFRIKQLKNLKEAVLNEEENIINALKIDLGKPAFETYSGELEIVYREINFAIRNLKKWMKPKVVKTSIIHFPSKSRILSEPKGIVLIISPWNYPVQLTLVPLIGAISAGNSVVVKPSEDNRETRKILLKLIKNTFNSFYISALGGNGYEVIPILLENYRFDHIFFTGSVSVGKIIAKAAVEKYSSYTLELGGKSPVIIDKSANLEISAKRILWAKFFNGGQSCVAPDYLLIHESVKKDFIQIAAKVLREFYGDTPINSKDLASIINEKRFNTLINYLGDGEVLIGGSFDRKNLKMEPTILDNVKTDSSVMQEEIFGPILPILSFSDNQAVLDIIENNPFPLALYIYTKDSKFEKFFIDRIQFGGGCINNSLLHLTNHHLPFGGIAYSGSGNYHGEHSYRTFSHFKSIVKTSFLFDLKMKYPPYTNSGLSLLRKMSLFLIILIHL